MTTLRGGPAISPKAAGDTKYAARFAKPKKTTKTTKSSSVLGLFPSTAIDQATIASILAGARTQVQKNYAAAPLPAQQTFLQPFADRRAANLQMAAAADSYLTGASANAQNISGAFNSAYADRLKAGQDATLAAGGSGAAGAIPPPAATLEPMQAIGSSWTNYLNALRPAMATRAQEANTATDTAEGKALADYTAQREKRSTDLETAIQTLFKSNLDTLQASKNDDYKNAVTAYAVLGKDAYNKALLKQRSLEFTATSGQKDRALDQTDTKIANTKAYQQKTLDVQRQKAAKLTGINTASALKTLMVTTTSGAAPGQHLGPQGQTGGRYKITPILGYAPNGTAIFSKTTRTVVVPYGKPVPVTNKNAKVDFQGQVFPPKGASTTTRHATASSWDTAVGQLKAAYPGRITKTWLDAYFPPRPAA